jgi:outer membrane protein TolC
MELDVLATSIEPVAVLDGPPAAGAAHGALLVAARLGRDDRRALDRRVEAADAQHAAAQAGRRPTIAIAGGVDYARPNPRIFPRTGQWDDSWDASLNVSWSLWDGGRTSAEVAQAAALGVAARERLKEFDSAVALEVRQRQLEIDSSRAAIDAAGDAVRAAAQARRVVVDGYRVGVATQTEVLDAELALLQAELDRTRALAGLRFAEARLARAIGR